MNRRNFIKIMAGAAVGGAAIYKGLDSFGAEAAAGEAQTLPAKHWGMVIDVSKFQGTEDIKQIAAACHQYNNVPDIGKADHEIKWIWQEDFEHTFAELESEYFSEKIKKMQYPVLCNHCENPPCVRVCPTQATFKRADGIVNMDYHRCIGCRFCMAACPFGARSFNFVDPRPHIEKVNPELPTRTKGVVEKCTFCVDRLEKGEMPVCAEVSKGAILFGDLNDPDSEIRKVLGESFFIRRKVELGTGPSVYYVIRGGEASA